MINLPAFMRFITDILQNQVNRIGRWYGNYKRTHSQWWLSFI